MEKISRIRNQQFYEESFMGKNFKGRSQIGRQKNNTIQMGIQSKTSTIQYGEIQDEVMRKRFPSSTRSIIHWIIFTSSKYINHFNITTHNITHGRSQMDMFDVGAASLNAELETPMYLEWPESMRELEFITEEEERKKFIKLVRSMYDNVDALLRWQNAFIKLCTN